MFAVYRINGDGYTYTYDTVLFVTACEQTAKDAVTLAELELEQALAIPYPIWTLDDIHKKGPEYTMKLIDEYNEKMSGIFTVEVTQQGQNYYLRSFDRNTSYYYDKVQVR
jgi:hypothetical protein